jgi:DNA-binding transcriptional ArsR family regulator
MPRHDSPEENSLLAALGHPLRRRILHRMADGGAISPRELATLLEHPLSNVSYHVRVLAECGAVTLVDAKPARGSMQHFYRATVEAPWARQILGWGESDARGPGESSGGAGT